MGFRHGTIATALLALTAPVSAQAAADAALIGALRGHVETLASDAFGGREPGTDGETQTLRYLARQWFDIGLTSGTNDPANPWFAPVDLVERVPLASSASFFHGRRPVVVDQAGVFVVTSGLRSLIEAAPLVLIGADTDPAVSRTELAGRIVVILDSQTTAATPEAADDRAGHLLDAGAAGVITVLDGARRIADVIARRTRPGYALAGQKLGGDVQAYVTAAVAQALFDAAGAGTLADLRRAAPGAAPRALSMTATLEATSRETRIRTHNLIAKIAGRGRGRGAVALVAHWDHFGRCADPPAEHPVCKGAVDNASGLAVITEAARILAKGRALDRDVYVLATTGEELGLLGARAFAENPPVPLDSLVAVFNVDSTGLVGAGVPVSVIGRGMTSLDDGIAAVLKASRRRQVAGDAANDFVRRQDGWVFIQHDVPAVMVSSAYSDPDRLNRFMDERYHRPADVPALVEYDGMADDVALQVDLVRYFADARRVSAERAKKDR